MVKSLAASKYSKLLRDIFAIVEDTRRTLVKNYWTIGRRLVEEEQDGAVRAAYSTGLLRKISDDLTKEFGRGFSVDNLQRMRKFYLTHPKYAALRKLDWTKQADILALEDHRKRRKLEQRAVREKLSSRELREIVRGENAAQASRGVPARPLPPLVRPLDLRLNTYRKSGAEIDCGFFISYPRDRADVSGVTFTDTPSYTYAARVDRVVDGDTLRVKVAAGFYINSHEKLRLRGINTPELGTPEGERAKKYVEKLLPVGSLVVIKSYKTRVDIYGRFVADLFYKKGCSDSGEIMDSGTYLNQQLLDNGYAVRMAE